MPRPKKPGAPEPKRRSRNGCWNCKSKKVKCGEEKPACLNCQRSNESCDYSIRLNWDRDRGNRNKRKASEEPPSSAPSMQTTFSVQQAGSATSTPARPSTSGGGQGGLLDPSMALTPGSRFSRDYSPAASSVSRGIGSPTPSAASTPDPSSHVLSNPLPLSMLPPFQPGYVQLQGSSAADADAIGPNDEPPMKKPRFSPGSEMLQPRFKAVDYGSPSSVNYALTPTSVTSHPQPRRSPDPAMASYGNIGPGTVTAFPPTPAASTTSDDVFAVPASKKPNVPLGEDDMRRMSVNSLLTESANENPYLKRYEAQKVHFGIDRGLPDYDIPNNADLQALSPATPNSPTSHKSFPGVEDDDANEFGFGLHGLGGIPEHEKTGVDVAIPRTLMPLPDRLKENPMNLLYFNHFVNHVSRILVPHDCSQNPFRNILPQMAVRDDNLLCLLLAYSASHRARLLGYKEPTTRIALWVDNVFPNLRHALDNPETAISNSTIATAIMLASREIIAPGSFGSGITWQNHLDLARRIISERGGPRSTATGSKDRVSYFLMRWFAYLDIVSTLMSGREASRYRRPSEDFSVLGRGEGTGSEAPGEDGSSSQTLSLYTPEYFAPDESYFRIDCLLGFTTRLVSLLARVAQLCRQCDLSPGRIQPSGKQYNSLWRPDTNTLKMALKLKDDIVEAKNGFFDGCPDVDYAETDPAIVAERSKDVAELSATNQAFHAAALVHLYRRVLGMAQGSDEVQRTVKEIVNVLRSLKKGGTAETALLFPMFTAGVEVVDQKDRELILDRVKGVEGSGMVQVNRARRLMEMVWMTGQPWETLVQGEFFG